MKHAEHHASPARRMPASSATTTPSASSITEKRVATFRNALKSITLRGLLPNQDRLKPVPFPYTPGHHEIQNLQAGQKISDGLWIARSERGGRPATVMWPHVVGFGKQWQAEKFHRVVHLVHPSDAVKIYKDKTMEDMLVTKESMSDAQEALFLRVVPYYGGEVRAAGKTCQVDYAQLLDWVREAPRWDGAQSDADQPATPVLIVAESAYDGSVVSLTLLLAATEGESAQDTRNRLVATLELKPQWEDAMTGLTSADFELLNRILTEG